MIGAHGRYHRQPRPQTQRQWMGCARRRLCNALAHRSDVATRSHTVWLAWIYHHRTPYWHPDLNAPGAQIHLRQVNGADYKGAY
jgi:hypothetical protein